MKKLRPGTFRTNNPEGLTAGPSTPLRSGRDDNFIVQANFIAQAKLSSRPERSGVEGPAVNPSPKPFARFEKNAD
jgi:hypothetical protein